MCATCGCGVDLGSVETVFAKNYQCRDCGEVFKRLWMEAGVPALHIQEY